MVCSRVRAVISSWRKADIDRKGRVHRPSCAPTHFVKLFVSPNSLRSTTWRNCSTACCFDDDGWSMGMSATCEESRSD